MRPALIATGLAVLAATAFASPATAEDWEHAAFYTGTQLTGDKTTVDLASAQCVNLTTPARSAINISTADIEVFYNTNCQKGLPGSQGDTYYVLGSLHQGNFGLPAASYRVR